ncbi:MAG: surface-adhesin E family protein, partial [Parasphingopyxis sp.]
GDRVTFWAHLFYQRERSGMKSARIQYEVNCSERQIRERRYLDYDRYRNLIASGDNSHIDSFREVAPDTSGSRLVDFACMAALQRRENFWSIAQDVDVFDVGEFYSDPRAIVQE